VVVELSKKLNIANCSLYAVIFCIISILRIEAQQEYPTLIQSSLEDEMVVITIDKPVYYPGDTIFIKVSFNENNKKIVATPILVMNCTEIRSLSDNSFSAVIPQGCLPGMYRVRLRVLDNSGQRYVYPTECNINVEERHGIEQLSRYVRIEPSEGGENVATAITLDRREIRSLRVIFLRDSIRFNMGPQYLIIRTAVLLRDGTITETIERRVLTFKSDADPNRDISMLIQYRAAYGKYSAISIDEFRQVQINTDTLPDWAVVKISIEPDYAIKISGYDRTNSYIRYFHVRGPRIEIGFSLGIPKVLYDSQADDPINYGNTSAMLRFYLMNEITGNRFPINLGIGTFGANSPIDVDIGRGGFALSIFFNLAEMSKILGLDIVNKITAGIELTPFFPIQKKWRFLINAQLGLAL
jgi:hypothetical protein